MNSCVNLSWESIGRKVVRGLDGPRSEMEIMGKEIVSITLEGCSSGFQNSLS